ncbi:MAG TPA: FmdB family zinc ribbon protein [Pyrinomonadaceae bacterium]|jgi:putative FmdB family regulatory protein|nr:FmdB family zinc ribbon protein [Pyrinomonadaceae bacterium]
MPIYEYSCQKCGAHVEALQKISDKPLARHEKCGGKLSKEWSRTGFQFKGSGWYVTDYAGKKGEAAESKSSDSTESKPAAEATDTKETKPAKESKKAKGPKASAAAAGD